MMFRRFFSKTIREAIAMRKHVVRLLHAQRDLMKPEALAAINLKMAELDEAIASKANTGKIRIKTQELQFAAEKWIKSYPNPVWRENVEVFLVAIVVAMAIRTFFLQPFKIPTGSMQPTLYGVTTTNCISDPNFKMPGFGTRIFDACVYGRFYHQILAEDDGQVIGIGPQVSGSRFINRQSIEVQ